MSDDTETVKDNGALDRPRAGVLLHITSLPGNGPCGELGPEARGFVDWLADCGLTVWQVLPLGPTHDDGSPYQSRSAHAGNPALISLQGLVDEGWLSQDMLGEAWRNPEARRGALYQAADAFLHEPDARHLDDYKAFLQEEGYWLDDFVLYQALRHQHGCAWWDWPEGVRRREPAALDEARAQLQRELQQHAFEQYVFFRQWEKLKAYANRQGVRVFGDLPIFVSHDSAEVWACPQDFHLDAHGCTTVVAGVPPDYFSETGQRWGNPLYNWERLQQEDFSFWVNRIRTQLHMYDLLRIDHFRGMEAYWEIPASEPTAIKGRWVKAPGDALLDRLHEAFDPLPLVAEDLGVITPEVEALRDRHGLPGMRVMQFGFFGDADNPHRFENHVANSVVYTGTHDNDTSLGWYLSLPEHERAQVAERLGCEGAEMPWPLIRFALSSPARLVVVPLQDFLGLDSSHRMNLPGTTEGNWGWRFDWRQVPAPLAAEISQQVTASGR